MKGKHSQQKETNNSNKFSKFWIILFLLILFLFTFVEIIYKNNSISLPQVYNNIANKLGEIVKNDDSQSNEVKEDIKTIKKVENADYLELTGLEISVDDGCSSIKTSIKNNSTETISNFVLDISIFDDNNNLLTKLSNPVQTISPNETLPAFGIVGKDISNAYTYKVEKN